MTGEGRSNFVFELVHVKEGIQTVDLISLGDTESLSQALGVAWRGKGQRYAPGRATASGEKAGLGAIRESIVSERNARAIPSVGKWESKRREGKIPCAPCVGELSQPRNTDTLTARLESNWDIQRFSKIGEETKQGQLGRIITCIRWSRVSFLVDSTKLVARYCSAVGT